MISGLSANLDKRRQFDDIITRRDRNMNDNSLESLYNKSSSNNESSFYLDEPNLEKMRLDRVDRNRTLLEAVDPALAKCILPNTTTTMATVLDNESRETRAAIRIQASYRGYAARKYYLSLLYERYEQEEAMRLEKTMQQVDEGELLVGNHQLSVDIEDNTTTSRNKSRQYVDRIITIQRAWRAYQLKDQHQKSSMTSNSSPSSDVEMSEVEAYDEPAVSTPRKPEKIHQSKPFDGSVCQYLPLTTLKPQNDSECESILSDYSELADPLIDHFTEHDVKIINMDDLATGNTMYPRDDDADANDIKRHDDESDEEFAKRVKKINYLSLAQEFAELKKIDANALPFDLHKDSSARGCRRDGADDDDATSPDSASARKTTAPHELNLKTSENAEMRKSREKSSTAAAGGAANVVAQHQQKNRQQSTGAADDGCDIYRNDGMMDWSKFEKKLKVAEEVQKKSRRNDREEIRRKLAMGADEDYYGGERAYKKPNLQTRLQSGMNLQICFMNESTSDAECADPDTENNTSTGGGGTSNNSSSTLNSLQQLHRINKSRQFSEFTKPMQICYINDMPLSDDEEDADGGAPYYGGGVREVTGGGLRGISEASDLEADLERTYLVDDDDDNENEEVASKEQTTNDQTYLHDDDDANESLVDSESTNLIRGDETEVAPLDLPRVRRESEESGESDAEDDIVMCNDRSLSRRSIVDDDDLGLLPKQIQPPVKLKTPSPARHSSDIDLYTQSKPIDGSNEDFFTKQARLQAEARMALAQVRPMAHMQLEIERQKKKKSPIADIMIGLPKITGQKQINGYMLYEMNIAQLQVLVNDLHSQIEGLNEELVQLLVSRDDNHMEQDSMLVDIEDLTRRAQEYAARLNSKNSREKSSTDAGNHGSSSSRGNNATSSSSFREKSNRKCGKKK
ncbi:uncharacterized protein LOC141910976 [Tubulanus polymorphus]|uniref:uncharacterized protein LOC141910976 n=1 Tax=Tubulanus polymorphus TaxID=672921 RepID=UPI003DA56878